MVRFVGPLGRALPRVDSRRVPSVARPLLVLLVAVGALGLAHRGDAPVPPAPPATREVSVVFGVGCHDLTGVRRRIPADAEPLTATLRQLFAGPAAGEAGVRSMFSPGTAALLRSVRVEAGRTYVDLDASVAARLFVGIPPACDRSPFGEQITVTLQQFPGVSAVHYALDGDPVAFARSAGGTCPVPPDAGGACDPAPFLSARPSVPGVKAPRAARVPRTDEFGTLRSVRQGSRGLEVQVDRVDMLTGDDARREARARGEDVTDYFLVDDSHRLRTYVVAPDARVFGSLGLSRTVEPTPATLAAWVAYVRTPAARSTLFHLTLRDGQVSHVEEQYRP